MSAEKVFQVKCVAQKNAWGRYGSNSTVALLAQGGNSEFVIDESTTYAELWMGTHSNGPSIISSSGEALSDWIKSHPEALGDEVQGRFRLENGQLPFLFKVLSVNKALSIQAHPNKELAGKLHKEKPDKYPDSNHKPEMAIALTQFEGLCGFRPKEEIVNFLETIPEFRAIVGDSSALALKEASADDVTSCLQTCFTALMTSDPDTVRGQVEKLAARLSEIKLQGGDLKATVGDLFLRLHSQFPGDSGCFCIYFLNRMILEPGEAMFLAANVPHAYLDGDCIECMACSDNVVRAGFTPKYKDVSVLCSMLDYDCKPPVDNLFPAEVLPNDPNCAVYDPPIPDFSVNKIEIPAGTKSYSISPLDSASMLLVIQGEAEARNQSLGENSLSLKRGVVIFVSAGESLALNVQSEGMLIFQAFCKL